MPNICRTCLHKERDAIEERLEGLTRVGRLRKLVTPEVEKLSEEYGLPVASLKNHLLRNHIFKPTKTMEQLTLESQALRTTNIETVESLIQELDGVSDMVQRSMEYAQSQNNERAVSAGAQQIRQLVLARAKLHGFLDKGCPECPEPPAVEDSPEFVALLGKVMRALKAFPDARGEVLKALE